MAKIKLTNTETMQAVRDILRNAKRAERELEKARDRMTDCSITLGDIIWDASEILGKVDDGCGN